VLQAVTPKGTADGCYVATRPPSTASWRGGRHRASSLARKTTAQRVPQAQLRRLLARALRAAFHLVGDGFHHPGARRGRRQRRCPRHLVEPATRADCRLCPSLVALPSPY